MKLCLSNHLPPEKTRKAERDSVRAALHDLNRMFIHTLIPLYHTPDQERPPSPECRKGGLKEHA